MKPEIGFIGLGVMGNSMAGHLMQAGYNLHIYNRTPSKAKNLIDKGAHWHNSPAEVGSSASVIFTMVGFPNDVEATYMGEEGIFSRMQSGSLLIDMTTSSPQLAVRIAKEAKEKGGIALDAPVSGGDIGAKEARLSIMVGGDLEGYQKALPLFEIMGKQINHMGGPGMGQYTKMSNQIAIASNMMGVCEALIYAEKSGLDPAQVLNAISAGAAGSASLINLAPRILKNDYAPGFYIKHFLKDMKIAIDSAKEMNLYLPGLELAYSLYESLSQEGFGDEGTQALIRWYKKNSNKRRLS